MKTYKYLTKGKQFEFDELQNPLKTKEGISIVIPTYNEGENLKTIIEEIKKTLQKTEFKNNYEIIIVDDNSKDKTPKILNELVKKENLIALYRNKKGIFTAVLDGIKISNGEYVLTMDADLSHPPSLIPKMLQYKDSHEMVIGSRYTKGGKMKSSLTRTLGGFFLNKICGVIIGTKVRDLGGNFRLFKKSNFEKIEFKYPCKFAEFGQELFYRAEKLGLKTKEIPFTYQDRKKGKSKMGDLPIKQAIHYLKRAFQLRFE